MGNISESENLVHLYTNVGTAYLLRRSDVTLTCRYSCNILTWADTH